ncbi:MAG: enoyl-CoA hydratase/isomerase family protein [Planctomycetota bacterium]|nr:enoyl-CoA hydratase/isomerase family protein [Planctomycetota bacterium]
MGTAVKVTTNPPSGTVILDRPEKRNALSRAVLKELQQAFEDLHQERSVRAVILTGAGSCFCAGMDLEEMRLTASNPTRQAQWYQDAVSYKQLIETMLSFPKPIIAAVNGPVVAGGAGLVLAADTVVATEAAEFGLPEPRRGLVAGLVAPLVHFRVGGGIAARLLLTAQMISADQACKWNLYHELVEESVIWPRAHEIAQMCAESAPTSLQLTKNLLNETIAETLSTMLSAGAAASATSRTTEAAAEGLAAFHEKRDPIWP